MAPLSRVPLSLSPYPSHRSLSQLDSNCWQESSLSVWLRVSTRMLGTYVVKDRRAKSGSKKEKDRKLVVLKDYA